MPDLDTGYVRERQPPCDCGTCEIWKSLHDEALIEVDRPRDDHKKELKACRESTLAAELQQIKIIEQRTKEAVWREVRKIDSRATIKQAIDSVGAK